MAESNLGGGLLGGTGTTTGNAPLSGLGGLLTKFWQNNKSWLIPVIMALVGAGGGAVGTNPSTLNAVLPDVYGVAEVRKHVDTVDGRVTNIENILNGVHVSPAPSNPVNTTTGNPGVIKVE